MEPLVIPKPSQKTLDRVRRLQLSYSPQDRINKMPVEVLNAIFTEAIADWANDPYALLTLSHVCKKWQNIIARSPLLHRSFAVARPELTTRHLERSRALPLDVAIIDVHHKPMDLMDMLMSIDLLGPQLGRVRSMAITTTSSTFVSWLVHLLSNHHSRQVLDHLSVTNHSPDTPIYLKPVVRPVAEAAVGQTLRQLASLSLRDVQVSPQIVYGLGAPREGPRSFHLRQLELVYTASRPPSTATLIRVLGCCPRLESLTLRSEQPVVFERTDDTDVPTGYPTSLKKLAFHGPSFKALVHILRRIDASIFPTGRFDLSFSMSDNAIEELLLPPPLDGGRVPKIGWPRGLRRLDVRSDDHQLLLLGTYTPTSDRTIHDPELRLRIDTHGSIASPLEPSLGFWSWPLKEVYCVEEITFELHGAFTMPTTEEQWYNLLRRMRSLRKIVLYQPWWIDARAMFRALEPDSEEPTADGKPPPRACPKLETVELVDIVGVELSPGRLSPTAHVLKQYPRCKDIQVIIRREI